MKHVSESGSAEGVVRGGRRRRKVSIGLAVAAVATMGTFAASPASAEENFYSQLTILSSGYSLDVQGDSRAIGAPIDVWYENSGGNQQWLFPATDGQVGEISSEDSQMCITTDGVAGDALYQFPCVGAATQQWQVSRTTTWWSDGGPIFTFENPATGLVMDVYGDSYSPGAEVDAWYPNGNANQSWA